MQEEGMQIPSLLRGRLLAAGLAVVAAGCSTVKVATDHDPAVRFGSWTSYAWAPEPADSVRDPRIDYEPTMEALRRTLGRELAAKGLREVSAERANTWIVIQPALDTQLREELVDQAFSRPADWSEESGWSFTDTRPAEVEVDEGSVTVTFLDPATREAVWTGEGRAVVPPGSSREDRRDRLQAIARRVLDRFPPTPPL
jgi:hypothetical protein